jgi:2-hydroxyglutarate dehydrogenase/L-2-hydroxyglutarate oxidase
VYDVVVVGGGIVGLATAFELLRRKPGTSVLVLDKEAEVGLHQTGHNSGVLHSGIYYKPGSLKARVAVRGCASMVRFCEEHGVPFELSGKVIVATSEEERPRLQELLERGKENGVPGLRAISPEELREIEPNARGVAALHSASTGIVSFRAVARAMASAIETAGGHVRTRARLLGFHPEAGAVRLHTEAGDLLAKRVITASGLHADRVAALCGAAPDARILPFRGEYYRLRKESRNIVRSLIYPVPDPRFPFLGVHFTRGIDGEVEAGPNAVLALAREGYGKTDVSARDLWEMARFPGTFRMARKYWRTGLEEYYRSLSKSAFVRKLQKLVPELTEDDLEPGGSGVRAMALERDGNLVDDFRIVESGGFVHVLSAPSPAATSSLAIAEHIVGLLD